MRSAHRGDNFIGSAIQTKGLGCILCSFRKRLIEWNTPRFNRRLVRVAKNPSTVFTHGHETDLLSILDALHDKGVGLLLHQQGLGTTSSAGKAMFQMLGVFAEFEQGIIRQRVNAGLARARANGDKLGRRRVKPSIEAQIVTLRDEGYGRFGKKLGIGTSVVQRVFKEVPWS
jgi:DNA invertase Pin-like site-specific DNA recombinase